MFQSFFIHAFVGFFPRIFTVSLAKNYLIIMYKYFLTLHQLEWRVSSSLIELHLFLFFRTWHQSLGQLVEGSSCFISESLFKNHLKYSPVVTKKSYKSINEEVLNNHLYVNANANRCSSRFFRLYILLPLDFLDRPCFNRLPLHIYILPKVAKYVLKMTLTQFKPILWKYLYIGRSWFTLMITYLPT